MKFLIMLLHTAGVVASVDQMSLIPDMSEICIYSDVCRRANDSARGPRAKPRPGTQSCCTECSCSEDCENDCCLPTKNELDDRKKQECFYLSTKQPPKAVRHTYKSYYVVTRSPPNGCAGNQIPPENPKRAAWKSVSPVFSNVSGKIFHSKQLANCFGETDVISWKSVFVCDGFSSTDTREYDLLTDPNSIRSPRKVCRMQYYYPGNKEDIKSEQCFKDLINTCDNSIFQLPIGMNMSHDEIKAACTSGLISPYLLSGQYANIFCHVCNGESFNKRRVCKETDQFKQLGGSLMGLLRDDLPINDIFDAPDKRKNPRMACPHQASNPSLCRAVLCPEGWVVLRNGTCVVPFTTLLDHRYHLSLTLTPLQNVTASDFEKAVEREDVQSWPQSILTPWSDAWRILVMYLVVGSGSEALLELLVVDQRIETGKRSFEDILNDINQIMGLTWAATIGNKTIEFKQNFGVRENKLFNMNSYPLPRYLAHGTIETREMRVFYSAKVRSTFPFHITKRFFCDQIRLNEGEFALTGNALTQNGTERVLLEFEFSLQQNLDGSKTVRICLNDSGFKELSSGVSSRISYTILLMVQIYLAYTVTV